MMNLTRKYYDVIVNGGGSNLQLKHLLGTSEPSFHSCIIAVSFDGNAMLIKAENNLEQAFDGSNLEDNLTNDKLLPKEAGIYKCLIRYHSFRCNHQLDPIEYDCNITIESIELINV